MWNAQEKSKRLSSRFFKPSIFKEKTIYRHCRREIPRIFRPMKFVFRSHLVRKSYEGDKKRDRSLYRQTVGQTDRLRIKQTIEHRWRRGKQLRETKGGHLTVFPASLGKKIPCSIYKRFPGHSFSPPISTVANSATVWRTEAKKTHCSGCVRDASFFLDLPRGKYEGIRRGGKEEKVDPGRRKEIEFLFFLSLISPIFSLELTYVRWAS